MATRIQHVGLVVSDLDRSRRFYADALGLEEVPRPQNFAFAGAWFRFGGHRAPPPRRGAHDRRSRTGRSRRGRDERLTTHLAFEVDDLGSACARLVEHGIALTGGPMPRGDGVTQVFFLDPDGYVLELFQWTHEDQADAPLRTPVRP